MTTKLYLDLETYSEAPIQHGTHAYAENAEIIVLAYALDTGPINVVDFKNQHTPTEFYQALYDNNTLIYAHNSHFDRTILRHCVKGLGTPPERWRDTMARALAHSLPGSLDTLSEIFNLPVDKAKDKQGKALIHLFCKPRPLTSKIRRATRETHPVEWQNFLDYARRDIESMRELDRLLPEWNYRGDELELWFLDQKINDRGFGVDIALAESALRTIDKAQGALSKRTHELTDGAIGTTQRRAALVEHIAARYDIALPDMRATTLEKLLAQGELPDEVAELFRIRLQASQTSTAKYKRLLQSVSSDGRLRGTMQYCGASRTGRFAGRLFNPLNLPRPSMKNAEIEQGIAALKTNCADLLYDNVMDLTSNTIRGCIIPSVAKKLVIADLSNIEGRVQAWLAGETWKLDAFRAFDRGEGADIYKLAYARAFRVDPESVDEHQRQIGKTLELSMGYQGAVGAFLTFATAFAIDLDALAATTLPHVDKRILESSRRAYEYALKEQRLYGLSKNAWLVCDCLKALWREAHPNIVTLWMGLDAVAREPLPYGTRQGPLVTDKVGNWMRIQLPSGRCLCYPSRRLEEGKITYRGVDPFSKQWKRLQTYGGKLFENVCQAVARDVMTGNMPLIEQSGYEILLSVHDEVITETPDTPEYSAEGLSALLAKPPAWAVDMPLAAKGFETYRYRKG